MRLAGLATARSYAIRWRLGVAPVMDFDGDLTVRRAVIVGKMSEREVARQFGLARETVRKMLR